MKKIIVGDVTDYLSKYAYSQDKNAKLLSEKTLKQFQQTNTGTFYTSIGDFKNIDHFCDCLMQVTDIEYHPPLKWSDEDTSVSVSMESETKNHLLQWSFLKKRPVKNLKVLNFTYSAVKEFLQIHQRVSESKQIWNIGCSITAGEGVEKDQTYGKIISNELNLPLQTIAVGGSSIKWAADQILCSAVRKDDLVIWGVTSFERCCYFFQSNKLYHINLSTSKYYPLLKKIVTDDWLLSQDNYYESLKSISAVNNFCTAIQAKLIMLGVFPFYTLQDCFSSYKNFIMCNKKYIDLGSDHSHPGPQQHAFYAKQLSNYIKNLEG